MSRFKPDLSIPSESSLQSLNNTMSSNNFDPTSFAHVQAQTFDLDDFDPDLVDYEAINAIAAETATANVNVESWSAGVLGYDAREDFDHAQSQTPATIGGIPEYDEDQFVGGRINDNPALELDIFNSDFQSIGTLYQPPVHNHAHSNLLEAQNGTLELGSNTIIPLVSDEGGSIGLPHDSGMEMGALLVCSTLPIARNPCRGAQLDGVSDSPSQNLGSLMRPNESNAYEALPNLSPSGVIRFDNSAPPAIPPAAVSKKRTERPLDSMEEWMNQSNPKRQKIAQAAKEVLAYDIPEIEFLDQAALFSSGGYEFDSVSTFVPQTSPQFLPTPQVQQPARAEPPLLVAAGQLLFTNHAHAKTAMATRAIPHDWKPLQNDESLPINDEHRSVYVQQLIGAFKDASQSIDSEDMKYIEQRWVSLAAGNGVRLDEQMEAICWQLLDIAEALHTRGPISLRVLDESRLRDIRKTQKLKFSDRINQTCDMLRFSKARCSKLLKSEGLSTVVATPAQLIMQTGWNKKQNSTRQESLIAGRKAQESQANANQDSDEDAYGADASDLTSAQLQPTRQSNIIAQDPYHSYETSALLDITPSGKYPLDYSYIPDVTHHSDTTLLEQTSKPPTFFPRVETLNTHTSPLGTTLGAAKQSRNSMSPAPPLRRKRSSTALDDTNSDGMPPAKRRGRKMIRN